MTHEVLNSKWSPNCSSCKTQSKFWQHFSAALGIWTDGDGIHLVLTFGLDLMSYLTLIVPERTHPPRGTEWHSCIDCMDRKLRLPLGESTTTPSFLATAERKSFGLSWRGGGSWGKTVIWSTLPLIDLCLVLHLNFSNWDINNKNKVQKKWGLPKMN